jgi:hypothetical protein
VNKTLAKNAMDELYLKIGVCAPGFITDLQTSVLGLSHDLPSFLADMCLKMASQAATAFVYEIIQSRKQYPLAAESDLVEIGEAPSEFSHARSELVNDLVLHSNFPLSQTLDLDAENYFSEIEKNEFRSKFLIPDNLQNNMLEILFEHFSKILYDVHSLEAAKNFFDQLNILGTLPEDASNYFELEPFRVKASSNVAKILRESILKRVLISNCLGEMFITRSVLTEEVSCDVLKYSLCLMLIKKAKKNFSVLIMILKFWPYSESSHLKREVFLRCRHCCYQQFLNLIKIIRI